MTCGTRVPFLTNVWHSGPKIEMKDEKLAGKLYLYLWLFHDLAHAGLQNVAIFASIK